MFQPMSYRPTSIRRTGVIEQYTKFVKPAFDRYVGPSRRYADVIIPWQRGDNVVAIDLITGAVQ